MRNMSDNLGDNLYALDSGCRECRCVDLLGGELREPFLCAYSEYNWPAVQRHVPMNFASNCPNFKKSFPLMAAKVNQIENPVVKRWYIVSCTAEPVVPIRKLMRVRASLESDQAKFPAVRNWMVRSYKMHRPD